jgi:hypothetical protein
VIVADGWTSIPPEYPDELPIKMEVLLRDERRRNEFYFEFEVRLDRSLKRKYERGLRERRERMGSTERSGLFGPARPQPGAQKSVSMEEPIILRGANGQDDRKLHKPN